MAKLTGTNPDQVPTNADLGTMAYQDKDQIKVGTIESTTESGAVLFKTGDDQYSSALIGKRPIGDNFANLEFDAGQTNGVVKIEGEGSGNLKFFTANNHVMTVHNNGNVGIGTQSPSSRLETVQTGQNTTAVFSNTNASWANDVSFVYAPSGSTVSDLAISSRSNGSIWLGSGYGPIHFQLDENEANSRSTKVTIRSDGYLTLNGNDIGGTQVTIADDAVASITPPRTGGFMFVTSQGTSQYPNVEVSGGMFYYDVGASLRLDKGNVFSSPVSIYVDVTTSDLTGTTGTDGYVTIAVQSGVIKIENRNGAVQNLQVTFL